jgi:hypothetical protein
MKRNSFIFLQFYFLVYLSLTSCSSQPKSDVGSDRITFRDNLVSLVPEPSPVSGGATTLLRNGGKMELAIESRSGEIYVRSNKQWNRVALAVPKKMMNAELFPDRDGGIFVTASIENSSQGNGSLRDIDALILKLDSTGNLQESFGKKGALIMDHGGFVETINSVRFENDTLSMMITTSEDMDKQRFSVVRASRPWISRSVSVTQLPVSGHFYIQHEMITAGKISGVITRFDPRDTYGVNRSLPVETTFFSIRETDREAHIDSLTMKEKDHGFTIHKLFDLGGDGLLAVTRNYNDSVTRWNAFKITHDLAVDTRFFNNGYLYPKDISLTNPFDMVVHSGVIYTMTFTAAKGEARTLKIESINPDGKKNSNRPIQVETRGFRSNYYLLESDVDGRTLFFITSSFRPSETEKPILHRVDLATGVYSYTEQWSK